MALGLTDRDWSSETKFGTVKVLQLIFDNLKGINLSCTPVLCLVLTWPVFFVPCNIYLFSKKDID